jgi:hypothetical protein
MNVPSRMKDLTGVVFGEMTVLGFAGYSTPRQGKRRPKWLVRCSCGKEKAVLGTTLRNTKVRSCGHLKVQIASETFRKPLHEVVRNNTMHHYKVNARRMGRSFELTEDQWFTMITSNCHYCGSPPSNIWNHRFSDEVFRYNGVDRVDNAQGYSPENTVPCCAPCNMMKRSMSVDAFINHIRKIAKFNNLLSEPTKME